MTTTRLRFEAFELDLADRRLTRDGAPVDLNPRYFDALVLLVSEQGRLVTKDRFMSEVWRGIPVTDEALTQCIRTLRRQLGDDAAAPRFIETVPKHGYRFIAAVQASGSLVPSPSTPPAGGAQDKLRPLAEVEGRDTESADSAPRLRSGRTESDGFSPLPRILAQTGIGIAGAAVAGLIGGIAYGLLAAAQPSGGSNGISLLLVLVSLTLLAALLGGAGVSLGMALARGPRPRPAPWIILGGATGGLLVGGVFRLLGMDAFDLLLGQAPGAITGAAEGALLGGATGLAVWLAGAGPRPFARRRSLAIGALVGGAGGLLIALINGRLMGGSLMTLADAFPSSRVRLDHVGGWFGEAGFGPITQSITCALEGATFVACLTTAFALAARR